MGTFGTTTQHRRFRAGIAVLLLLAALTPLTIGAASAEDARVLPVHDDTLYTETLRVGPLNLKPDGQPGSMAYKTGLMPRPAGAWVLKSFNADITYADGTPVPRTDVHLHHVAIARVNQEDPACPGRTAGGLFPNLKVSVILASGAERTPIEFGDPFGYFEPAGSWGGNYHIVNASASNQSVYLDYTVTYLKGNDHPELIPATPYFMDVVGDCGNAEYNIPASGDPNTTHVRTWDFEIKEQGTVLGTGGHLHNHGVATELYDGSSKLLCRSEAVYDGDGGHNHSAPLDRTGHHTGHEGAGVAAMTPCPWVMETVEPGEKLQLRSIYHDEVGVVGAMGINITVIAHNFTPPPEWFPQVTTTTAAPTTTTTTAPTTTAGQQSTTTAAQQTTTTVAPPATPVTATPTYTG